MCGISTTLFFNAKYGMWMGQFFKNFSQNWFKFKKIEKKKKD